MGFKGSNPDYHNPPKSAQRFLSWFLRDDYAEEVQGDLDEQFYAKLSTTTAFRAKLNYWYQVINYLRPFAISKSTIHFAMYRHYFTISIRTLLKQKLYTFINLTGLTAGIAACVLILLYVQNEMSYDKHFDDHERIYRISRSWLNADGKTNLHLGHLAPPFSPHFREDYAGLIDQSVRLYRNTPLLSVEDKMFEAEGFFFADPEFLDVFSWKLIEGDPASVLKDPYSIVLTEEMAKKYFGDEDAMGKSMNFNNSYDLVVTGIIENMPENSHFHPTMFAPMKLVEDFYGGQDQMMGAWGSNNFSTFIKFNESTDIGKFETELSDFYNRHFDEPEQGKSSDFNRLHLMNIADIHLHSHLDSEIEQNGDIAYIYLFIIVAGFILVIATINYVNLATARSAMRAKEIGIRKAIGAFRQKLIGQFLTESMIFTFISVLLACLAVVLLLPWFNNFSHRSITFDLLNNHFLLGLLLGITLLTGLLAGSYPALYLSSFEAISVLKGKAISKQKGGLRSVLVVFQFFISIVMLIGVGVVNDQLDYVKNKDLGFGTNRVMVVHTNSDIRSKYENIKNQLLSQKGIQSVGLSSRIPSGRLLDSQGGSVEFDGDMMNLNFRLADVHTDFDFLKTMEIPVIAGRDFDKNLASDSTEAFIINEAAVRAIGYKNNDQAIDKKINYGGRSGYITGVVKDFHFESLKQEIAPIIFMITQGRGGSLALKLDEKYQDEAIAYVKEQWEFLRPGRPFDYYFVDARFNELYESDERVANLVNYFSVIAVILSISGLFGLASFTTEQRTKEIGLRKVMGASFSQILILLTRGFTSLVLLGFIFAVPVAYWLMAQWLDNFAYHGSIGIVTILAAGISAIVITWITVGINTFKAANANPVDSFRDE